MSAISHRSIRRTRRVRAGAAVVEATLTMMLFLAFVFSIFDFGFVTYSHHTIQERAAEAVRYGVVRQISTASCVSGGAAVGTESEMVKILLYGSPTSTSTGTGLLGLTANEVRICRDIPYPFTEERLRLRVSGYRFPLINYFVPGMHTARTFTVSLPMEYAPPPPAT